MAADAGMTDAEIRQTAIDARRVADEALAATPPSPVVVQHKMRTPSLRSGGLRVATVVPRVPQQPQKSATGDARFKRAFDAALGNGNSNRDSIGDIIATTHPKKHLAVAPTQTRVAIVKPRKPMNLLPTPYT